MDDILLSPNNCTLWLFPVLCNYKQHSRNSFVHIYIYIGVISFRWIIGGRIIRSKALHIQIIFKAPLKDYSLEKQLHFKSGCKVESYHFWFILEKSFKKAPNLESDVKLEALDSWSNTASSSFWCRDRWLFLWQLSSWCVFRDHAVHEIRIVKHQGGHPHCKMLTLREAEGVWGFRFNCPDPRPQGMGD